MKTMKIWRLAFAMLAAFSLTSCSSDDNVERGLTLTQKETYGQNITNSRVITHSRLANQDYTMRVWMEYPNASLTAVYRIGGFKEKKTKTVDTSRMGY